MSWKDKMSNKEVLKMIKVNQPELVADIMKRKLSYYGHTRRHHSMQKLIVEGKVEGKRGRGRRRKSWTGNIAEMTGECVNVCGELALDRTRWRTMASNLYKETEPR